jgi:hypothetical protein
MQTPTIGTQARLTLFFILSAVATKIATQSIPATSGRPETATTSDNLNPTIGMIRQQENGLSPESASRQRRMSGIMSASL